MTVPLFPTEPQKRSPLALPLFPDAGPTGPDPLGQAVRIGSAARPDSAARVLRLQSRTGLAPDLIARNLDQIEREVSRTDFDPERFRQTSPIVAGWMAENPNHAAAAMDDFAQLGRIEGMVTALKRGAVLGKKQSEVGRLGFEEATRGALDPAQKARLAALEADLSREPSGLGFLNGVMFQGAKIYGQMADGFASSVKMAGAGAGVGAAMGALGGPLAPVTSTAGALAGAGAGFAAGMGGYAFQVEAGHAYQELKAIRGDDGQALDDGAVTAAATGIGVLNAALEVTGLRAIGAPVKSAAQKFVREAARDALVRPTTRAAITEFGKVYATALATETGTEVVQEITNIVGAEVAKMASTGQFATLMRDPAERELAIDRLAQVATQTAQGMLLVGLPGASVNLATDVVRARRAQERSNFYLALGEAVQGSKTFERLPESLQEIVRRATADGPIETAYVDIGPFDEYFQSQQIDPRAAAAELLGSAEEYDQARQTGAALAIPMARYATKIAPTEHNAFFSRELRLVPDDMNAREAEEFIAAAEQQAQAPPEEAGQASAAEQLQQTVAAQIEATGRFRGQDAQTLASQMAAFFTTTGQRFGIDPIQLFNRYGLQVLRGEAVRPEAHQIPRPDQEAALEREALAAEASVPVAGQTTLRNEKGRLPTSLEDATDQQLADEFGRLIEANNADAELAVPSVIEDEHGLHPDMKPHVAMKGRAIKASGRIAQRKKSIERIEAELKRRGVDPAAVLDAVIRGEAVGADDFNFGANVEDSAYDQAAYHGSPHVFTKFSLHAIGTGEGQQAFGWGLYFASKKEIAKHYRDTLSGKRYSTKFGVRDHGSVYNAIFDEIRQAVPKGAMPADHVRAVASQVLEALDDVGAVDAVEQEYGAPVGSEAAWTAAVEYLRGIEARPSNGRLYRVEIPDDDSYLIWEAPLSDQPAAVQRALKSAVARDVDDSAWPIDRFDLQVLVSKSGSGASLYEQIAARIGSEQASRFLAGLGLNGVKYLDGSSRTAGEGSYNYVVFDDNLIEIVEYEQRLQGDPGNPRGRIRIGANRQIAIDLLEGADFSTFLHESGHFYLEVLKDLAGESPENAADFDAILRFLGVQSADQIGRAEHEKFARATEAYFMEGAAPSIELRRAFYRFKAWLKALYTTIRGLEVELTPQVRRVFDRMFATDAEIDAAENEAGIVPIFTTAEDAGMSEIEFAAYRQTVEDAHIQAVDRLRAKVMQDELRQERAWWREARAFIRSEVEGEISQEPVYRALAMLQKGVMPDGTTAESPVKLSREAIVATKGEDFLKRLPRPYVYAKTGGLSPDQAAELFGFTSGDELLTAMATAPRKDQVIEGETDRRLQFQFGDMMADGKIVEEAEQSVLDEGRADIIRAELRALRAKARQAKPFVDAAKAEAQSRRQSGRRIVAGVPSIETVRAMARDRIAMLKIRDIRPHRFWVAARKAGKEAFQAAADGDYVAAANAKQAELLSVELYREATRVRAETDGIAEYARGLMRTPAQRRIGKAGWEYLEQINALLERFDFSPLPLSEGARRQGLAAFVKAQEEKGLPVNIPDEILNEAFRTPWKEMTYGEIAGVRDVLKHIEHLATLKNKLLAIQKQRELDELTADAARSIEEHAKRTLPPEIETRVPGEQIRRAVDGWFASHRKLAHLMREMDGFADNGVMWNLIVRPLNAAADAKSELNREITAKLAALFEAHYSKADMIAMYRKEYLPPVHASLTKMGRLMIALNWGAEDNRAKLLEGLKISTGREITESDVEAVIDTLDARDMEFVQGIWDAINDYWPQLEALAERLDGIPPEKIEAAEVKTRHGVYRGGYFPLVYDDRQSRVAHRNVVAKTADALKRGATARNSTKAGARHERVAGVRMPIRLDFGVIFEHFESIAQDITHTEPLIDIGRIVSADNVEDAIRAHYGDTSYKLILSALEDIAAGDKPAQNWFEKSLNWVRVGTTIAGLGWNLTTSLLQPLGLTQSMVRIGPKWVGRGLTRWLRDAATAENSLVWIREKSSFMRTRTSTQMREVAEVRNRIGLTSGRMAVYADMGIDKATLGKLDLQDVEDSYFWLISRMQLVADIPTWLGAYEKALDGGADEATAVALADQAVIEAQGSGTIKDLAEVQRGTPALKLWTNFYSFFNTTWNLHVDAVGRTNFKSPMSIGRLAVDALLLTTVPAVLGLVVRNAAKGEDEPLTAEEVTRAQLGYLTGMLVGVREMGGVIAGFSGYEGPAGARFFSEIGKLSKQVGQGDADQAAFRALNNSAGILFHYPAGQVQRTVEGLMYLEDSRSLNPAALMFGAPRK